jgi:chemotaxis protein methyltransferase CheR
VTTDEIPATLTNEFSATLARRLGLHFPGARSRELLRGMTRAAQEFGFAGADSCEACMRWLLTEPPTRRQDEILASHLAVGETYFFREPAVFSVLEHRILGPLIAARRSAGKRLRIWSAGCSSGEETYSLAILLARLIPDIDDWSIHLLGTDINPHCLDAAKRGLYRDWSFRGVPPWLKDQCFEADRAGNYLLRERFRRLARFAYLNLAADAYPSPENATQSLDVVMCRNVLMYFGDAVARTVVQKLHRALADGGWLIVGQAERAPTLFEAFVPVTFEGGIVYRKGGGGDEAFDPMPAADQAPMTPVDTDASPAPAASEPSLGQAEAETAARDEPAAAATAARSHDAQELASLARACADLHELDDARRWCEAAVAADKFDARLRYLLATILTEQGDSVRAATVLKQALYLDPCFIVAHFALGNLYRRDGRASAASKHFAIASRLLRVCSPEYIVPDADGLTARRLLTIIDVMEHSA